MAGLNGVHCTMHCNIFFINSTGNFRVRKFPEIVAVRFQAANVERRLRSNNNNNNNNNNISRAATFGGSEAEPFQVHRRTRFVRSFSNRTAVDTFGVGPSTQRNETTTAATTTTPATTTGHGGDGAKVPENEAQKKRQRFLRARNEVIIS